MKKKLFIVIFSLILIVTAVIVYGATVKIEYNYNVKVETPSFAISDGKISVSMTNQDTQYTIDKDNSYVDILEKTDFTFIISKKQKISDITNLDSSKSYKIFANTITYTKSSDTYVVQYHNEYVSNKEELKEINYSNYYNNIFDYSKNTNNLALRIVFVKSFTLDEEITIKAPVSITILNNLTLSNNLNIINSYAGNYDITLDGDTKINSNNSSKIIIQSEKANYKYASNNIIELNENISIDSAKDFIHEYIPSYLVTNIYLPKSFLSSSITFDYYVIDQTSDEDIKFNGIFENVSNYVKDNILKVKVKVTSENEVEYVTKNIICGNSIDSLKLILEEELGSTYKPNDFDFLYLIQSLDVKTDLTFIKNDGFDVIINNTVVESSTTLTYDSNNKYYIDSATNKITSIVFRRKSIATTSFTLNINSTNIIINLKSASKDEIVEYIKQNIHAYIVTSENLAYNVLNIKNNKVYLGTTDLDITSTGLFTNITYKIVSTDGTEITYYKSDNAKGTITVDSTKEFTNLLLNYYDDDTLLFSVPIKRSLSSNSGDDIGFESNNPFDSLFNSETNWLTNNSFVMPESSTYSAFYAKINIVKINGVAYDTSIISNISVRGDTYQSKTHNMISISQSGNAASSNSDYTKQINFTVDYDYIPNFDSQIQVECLLYNNDAKEVTATQIYTFTVPGILKWGTNDNTSYHTPCVFSSSDFYNDILNYFKDNSYSSYYIDIDQSKSYILSAAKNASSIVVSGTNKEISVDGIEYFTYTNNISISNYKITSLTAFTYLSDDSLTSLTLDSNNITLDIIGTNLYNLRLSSLSLKDNDLSNLTSFKGMFFRTIKEINLNSCKLKTIEGMDNLVNLNILHIESNNIDQFEVLKNLDYLTDVYLSDNTIEDNTYNYYGTDGIVNEVVYYWLRVTYGTVIHKGEKDTNNYIISSDRNHNSILLYLNAVCVPTKMKEVEYNDLITNLKANNIMKVTCINNRLVVSYTSNDETLYREFYIEVTN